MAKRTISKTDTVSTLGRRITEARTAKGMTAYRVAQKLKVSRAAVWSWEHGRRIPRFYNLHRLAKVLGVTVAAILPDAPEETTPCYR
jgi:transcriptional regulator with XRE-family HTH domain